MEELVAGIEPGAQAHETLAKVLGNIVQNPAEPKFRTLKKDNRMIKERICSSEAAVSLLLALGFEDDGATYRLPGDADLERMAEAAELLQCIVASQGEEAASSPGAQGPAQGQAAPQQAAAGAPAPAGAPAADTPKAEAGGADAKKKPVRSAFDFESRSRQEQQQQKVAAGLQELRQQQRDKFKDFQQDPNAKQSEAYQRPASIAAGGEDKSWGNWFSNMWGGSSSGSGGGGGGGRQPPSERRGPNVKGMGDLPKPVRRG